MLGEETRAAVRKGVSLLDEVAPDWREYIDKSRLLMHSGDRCILGELFGNYWAGLYILFGDFQSSLGVEHGFSMYTKLQDIPGWNYLTEAWLEEIGGVPYRYAGMVDESTAVRNAD